MVQQETHESDKNLVVSEVDQSTFVAKHASTRTACFVGLAFAATVGAGSSIAGLILFHKPVIEFHATPFISNILPLIINLFLAIGTEVLGYIHGTTLKWALFREGRLHFNANLRLFTTSQTSMPNNACFNSLYLISLAVCYAASPLIIVTNNTAYDNDDALEAEAMRIISAPALLCLGGSVLSMCFICLWGLLSCEVLTWSSCPLSTLAVAIQCGQKRQEGRCMMSVGDKSLSAKPQRPQHRQCSAYAACKQVRRVIYILAAALVFLFTLSGVGYVMAPNSHLSMPGWGMLPDNDTPEIVLNVHHPAKDGNRITSPAMGLFCGLLITTGLQAIITAGIHCAELQITLSRDEKVWRSLLSTTGKSTKTKSPFRISIGSWQSLTLMICTPIIHWQYGLAVTVDYLGQVYFYIPQLCYLAMMWAIFLGFVLFVSFRQPKGPLPATYGHVQSMLDIVDELGDHLFWGDKGEVDIENGRRRAGTATKKLPQVDMNAVYG